MSELGRSFQVHVPGSGVDGSLSDRLTAPRLQGRIFGKTGSLAGVKTLAGYTTTSYAFLSARNFTVQYGYDYASNRKTMIDAEGGQYVYTYDALNRLYNLQDFQQLNYGFGYDALSRRTSLTRANSITTSYSYDSMSRLLSILHKNAGGTTLDGAAYTYDAAGNRQTRTDKRTAVKLTYGYDNLYQLLSAKQGTTTKESYTLRSGGE